MQQPIAPQPQRIPPWVGGDDNNRIDINLIAMLLWQSLLTGVSVTVSHLDWYLPDASPGEMGLQYGLIAFGFLCVAMVLFHVGDTETLANWATVEHGGEIHLRPQVVLE